MGNITDERINKAKIWFNDLEKYAKEKKMPARILDEIEECSERLSLPEIKWDDINLIAGELLESIEEKVCPEVVQSNQVNQEVSVRDVEEQIKGMAQRCHAENITSVESMAERKNIVIKKSCEQLMEISHTKAHLEELKNEDLYFQFFRNCKSLYEKDVLEMIRDMLQSISGNYSHMLNHMRSMFQSIGGFKNGVGSEKFYREYEERRVGIDAKVQGEAETADIGENDILSFGQKTGKKIKSIVRKLVWKRKILAWVPLVIFLCLFVGSAIGNQEQSREVIESIDADSDADSSPIKEIAKEWGSKIIKDAKNDPKSIKSVLSYIITLFLALAATLGAVLILVAILVIVLYCLYLRILKVWCNHQICSKCGMYLEKELISFTQNNNFASKLDMAMKNAMEEYERQYMIVLNNIFQGTAYDSDREQESGKTKISILRDEWNRIIYE